MTEKENILLIL